MSEKKSIKEILKTARPDIQKYVHEVTGEEITTRINASYNSLYERLKKDARDLATELYSIPEAIVNALPGATERVDSIETRLVTAEDKMKGLDFDKIVFLTLAEIQKLQQKASSKWGIAGFISGLLSGIVLVFYTLGLI